MINVGTMMGRSRDVCKMASRCVLCSGGFVLGGKLWSFWRWSREIQVLVVKEKKDKRGDVGIMLREDLAKDVVEVQWLSSRVRSIKMILDRKVCHVVLSYTPQGGRSEEKTVCQVVSSCAPQGGRSEEEKVC